LKAFRIVNFASSVALADAAAGRTAMLCVRMH
jgi:hypothetical protein